MERRHPGLRARVALPRRVPARRRRPAAAPGLLVPHRGRAPPDSIAHSLEQPCCQGNKQDSGPETNTNTPNPWRSKPLPRTRRTRFHFIEMKPRGIEHGPRGEGADEREGRHVVPTTAPGTMNGGHLSSPARGGRRRGARTTSPVSGGARARLLAAGAGREQSK